MPAPWNDEMVSVKRRDGQARGGSLTCWTCGPVPKMSPTRRMAVEAVDGPVLSSCWV